MKTFPLLLRLRLLFGLTFCDESERGMCSPAVYSDTENDMTSRPLANSAF